MFFDEPGPDTKSQKSRLRLVGLDDPREPAGLASARARLQAARDRREDEGPSLLDRIDSIGREPEPDLEPVAPQSPGTSGFADYPHDNHAQTYASNQSQPQWQSAHGDSDGHGPLVDPLFVIDAIRRWKYLIATTTILGGLLGTAVALNTPKLYTSATQILIDPRNYKVIENDINPDVFLSEAALAIVDSQVNIIRSPIVMDKVATKLNLDLDPEFNGSQSGLFGTMKQLIGLGSNSAERSAQTGTAIRNLNQKSEIDRQAGTFIVNIRAASEEPEKAALIANTIAEVYMRERATGRSATADRTSGALQSRLPELKKQVEVAENAVARFKSENDLFDAQGRQIDDESVLRLNEQLNSARSATVSLNAKAQSAKAVTADAIATGDLPEEIASSQLGALRGRYTGELQRMRGLEAKLGPMHPDLLQAQSEAASLKSSINSEIKRIRSSIQTELKRAVQTEQQLAANLAQIKSKVAASGGALVQLRELERSAASARTVYEQFLLRAQETSEQGTIDSTNVEQTNVAKPSDEAEGTSRKLIMLGGFLGGFIFGLALAILKGMWDALMAQYSARLRHQPGDLVSAPYPSGTPSPSGRSSRPEILRGSFQGAARQSTPVPPFAQTATAQAGAEPNAAQTQVSHQEPPMHMYPVSMQSPVYAQPQQQVWAPGPQMMMQPQQMPMYMPQPMPVMAPQMMMPQQGWYPPAPQMWAHPQPVQYAQQPMPAPQTVYAQPQPVEQPRPQAPATPAQQAEIAPTAVARRELRPLPANPDMDDIFETLAEMKAQLIDLSRQRRRA